MTEPNKRDWLICPLFFAADTEPPAGFLNWASGQQEKYIHDTYACLKDRCAWWIPEANACSVKNITLMINVIRDSLEQMGEP